MDEKEFDSKISEYLILRDKVYAKKNLRSGSYLIDTMYFSLLVGSITAILGIVCLSLGKINGLFSIGLSVLLFFIFTSSLLERKFLIKKINVMGKSLNQIRNENTPKFDNKIIFIDDYLKKMGEFGFDVKIIKKKNKTTYEIKKENNIFLIQERSNTFFYTCICKINKCKFEYIEEKSPDLQSYISNYRINIYHKDHFGKMENFIKYLILKY